VSRFWIFILFIVGINLLKQIAEKNRQAQQRPEQRKRYPELSEDGVETPTVVVRRPVQQQRQVDTQEGIPPVFGTGPRGTVFDQWFEEGQQEEGVAWEAQRDEIAEFLGIKPKPVPVVAPPMPIAEEVKPEPVRVEPRLEEVPRPRIPVARRKRVPVRKRAARVPADVLPPGIFRDMDDVRRGIIVSEILGPPKGLQ
jgi:hypothetical protein